MVASSDMSHYLPDDVTREIDQRALEPLLALDAGALYRTVRDEDISMCGDPAGDGDAGLCAWRAARTRRRWSPTRPRPTPSAIATGGRLRGRADRLMSRPRRRRERGSRWRPAAPLRSDRCCSARVDRRAGRRRCPSPRPSPAPARRGPRRARAHVAVLVPVQHQLAAHARDDPLQRARDRAARARSVPVGHRRVVQRQDAELPAAAGSAAPRARAAARRPPSRRPAAAARAARSTGRPPPPRPRTRTTGNSLARRRRS